MTQPDPFGRKRHTSQAYAVSTFGKSLETAKSGYGRRLQGSPVYAIPFTLDGLNTDPVDVGDLTAGLWIKGFVVHSVNAGTVRLSLKAEAAVAGIPAKPEVVLAAALPLTVAAITDAAGAALLMPLETDRVLVADVTDGVGTSPVRISLLVAPITDSWF